MIVRAAKEQELSVVCETLVAGFVNDPFIHHMFPDEGRRNKSLMHYFATYCDGCELLLADDYSAAAVYYGPRSQAMAPGHADKVAARIHNTCGVDAPTVLATHEAMGRYHPKDPHLHVLFLGVRPERRGGTGLAMAEALLDAQDREGVPCFTEATRPRTRVLYLRYGLRDAGETIREGATLELFPLWRAPGTPRWDAAAQSI